MSSAVNNTYKAPVKLPVWNMNTKGTLYLTQALMDEIEYLHRRVGSIEWCGPLIYEKLEGDLSAPSTLKIRAHHVFPMDIGSPGYTAATLSAEDMIELYEWFPGLSDGTMKQGLIHTHHTMSTFFSGTDMDELQDNTPNHNYYLSLIVNFSGEWCAKVAFVASLQQRNNNIFTFKGTEDQEASFENEDSLTKQVLMTIDMNIVKEGVDNISQEFHARFRKLEEAKKRVATSYNYNRGTTSYTPQGGVSYTPPKAPQGQKEEGSQGGEPYLGKKSMEQGELYASINKEKNTRLSSTEYGIGFGDDPTFQPEINKETTKESKKIERTPQGKIDRISDSTASAMILEWLKFGCMKEFSMEKKSFSGINDAVKYFDEFFDSMYGDSSYGYWLDTMQASLYDICKEYSHAVVSVRLCRSFESCMHTSRCAHDLWSIVDNYIAYAIDREYAEKKIKLNY